MSEGFGALDTFAGERPISVIRVTRVAVVGSLPVTKDVEFHNAEFSEDGRV